MPKYFFDFIDRNSLVSDQVGVDLADLPAVRRWAADQARDLIQQGRANREDRSDWVFEIKDQTTQTVLAISFGQAASEEAHSEPSREIPSAGPHATAEMTNPDATPGTGMLPPVGSSDDPNLQSTS